MLQMYTGSAAPVCDMHVDYFGIHAVSNEPVIRVWPGSRSSGSGSSGSGSSGCRNEPVAPHHVYKAPLPLLSVTKTPGIHQFPNMVFAGASDGTVFTFSASNRQLLRRRRQHEHAVRALRVMSASSKARLLTASDDWTCKVWDIATGKVDLVLRSHSGPVVAVAEAGAELVVTASSDHRAKLWDLRIAAESGHVLDYGHGEPITSLAVFPREGRVVTANCTRQAHAALRGSGGERAGGGGGGGEGGAGRDGDGTVAPRKAASWLGGAFHRALAREEQEDAAVHRAHAAHSPSSAGADVVRVWDLRSRKCRHELNLQWRKVALDFIHAQGAGGDGATPVVLGGQRGATRRARGRNVLQVSDLSSSAEETEIMPSTSMPAGSVCAHLLDRTAYVATRDCRIYVLSFDDVDGGGADGAAGGGLGGTGTAVVTPAAARGLPMPPATAPAIATTANTTTLGGPAPKTVGFAAPSSSSPSSPPPRLHPSSPITAGKRRWKKLRPKLLGMETFASSGGGHRGKKGGNPAAGAGAASPASRPTSAAGMGAGELPPEEDPLLPDSHHRSSSYARHVKCQRQRTMYNQRIAAFGLARQPDAALQILDKMKAAWVFPDNFTYHCLVVAQLQSDKLDGALETFLGVSRSTGSAPNERTCVALLQHAGRQRRPDLIPRILAAAAGQGRTPTASIAQAHVEAWIACGDVRRGRTALAEMARMGLRSEEPVFLALLRACRDYRLVDEGMAVFQSMETACRTGHSIASYKCMFEIYVKAADLAKALAVLQEQTQRFGPATTATTGSSTHGGRGGGGGGGSSGGRDEDRAEGGVPTAIMYGALLEAIASSAKTSSAQAKKDATMALLIDVLENYVLSGHEYLPDVCDIAVVAMIEMGKAQTAFELIIVPRDGTTVPSTATATTTSTGGRGASDGGGVSWQGLVELGDRRRGAGGPRSLAEGGILTKTVNRLLAALAPAGRVDDCLALAALLDGDGGCGLPDGETTSFLIAAHIASGNVAAAMRSFEKLLSDGGSAQQPTPTAAAGASPHATGGGTAGIAISIYNALLRGFAVRGALDTSLQVLDFIPPVRLNAETLCQLGVCCLIAKDYKPIIDRFDRLVGRPVAPAQDGRNASVPSSACRVKPTRQLLEIMMQVHAAQKDVAAENVAATWDHLAAHCLQPRQQTYAAGVAAFVSAGNVDAALDLVERHVADVQRQRVKACLTIQRLWRAKKAARWAEEDGEDDGSGNNGRRRGVPSSPVGRLSLADAAMSRKPGATATKTKKEEKKKAGGGGVGRQRGRRPELPSFSESVVALTRACCRLSKEVLAVQTKERVRRNRRSTIVSGGVGGVDASRNRRRQQQQQLQQLQHQTEAIGGMRNTAFRLHAALRKFAQMDILVDSVSYRLLATSLVALGEARLGRDLVSEQPGGIAACGKNSAVITSLVNAYLCEVSADGAASRAAPLRLKAALDDALSLLARCVDSDAQPANAAYHHVLSFVAAHAGALMSAVATEDSADSADSAGSAGSAAVELQPGQASSSESDAIKAADAARRRRELVDKIDWVRRLVLGRTATALTVELLVGAYCACGALPRAERLVFHDVRRLKMVISVRMYSDFLQAALLHGSPAVLVGRAKIALQGLLNVNVHPELETFHLFLRRLGEAGEIKEALDVLSLIPQPVRKTTTTFNLVLRACAKGKDLAAAQEVFQAMKSTGHEINRDTTSHLIELHGSVGELREARELLIREATKRKAVVAAAAQRGAKRKNTNRRGGETDGDGDTYGNDGSVAAAAPVGASDVDMEARFVLACCSQSAGTAGITTTSLKDADRAIEWAEEVVHQSIVSAKQAWLDVRKERCTAAHAIASFPKLKACAALLGVHIDRAAAATTGSTGCSPQRPSKAETTAFALLDEMCGQARMLVARRGGLDDEDRVALAEGFGSVIDHRLKTFNRSSKTRPAPSQHAQLEASDVIVNLFATLCELSVCPLVSTFSAVCFHACYWRDRSLAVAVAKVGMEAGCALDERSVDAVVGKCLSTTSQAEDDDPKQRRRRRRRRYDGNKEEGSEMKEDAGKDDGEYGDGGGGVEVSGRVAAVTLLSTIFDHGGTRWQQLAVKKEVVSRVLNACMDKERADLRLALRLVLSIPPHLMKRGQPPVAGQDAEQTAAGGGGGGGGGGGEGGVGGGRRAGGVVVAEQRKTTALLQTRELDLLVRMLLADGDFTKAVDLIDYLGRAGLWSSFDREEVEKMRKLKRRDRLALIGMEE